MHIGIACGTGQTFEATGRALYVSAGPEWKIRRGKRFAPFAQTLVGLVLELIRSRGRFSYAACDTARRSYSAGLM
jgi:hypothetical protein